MATGPSVLRPPHQQVNSGVDAKGDPRMTLLLTYDIDRSDELFEYLLGAYDVDPPEGVTLDAGRGLALVQVEPVVGSPVDERMALAATWFEDGAAPYALTRWRKADQDHRAMTTSIKNRAPAVWDPDKGRSKPIT